MTEIILKPLNYVFGGLSNNKINLDRTEVRFKSELGVIALDGREVIYSDTTELQTFTIDDKVFGMRGRGRPKKFPRIYNCM